MSIKINLIRDRPLMHGFVHDKRINSLKIQIIIINLFPFFYFRFLSV